MVLEPVWHACIDACRGGTTLLHHGNFAKGERVSAMTVIDCSRYFSHASDDFKLCEFGREDLLHSSMRLQYQRITILMIVNKLLLGHCYRYSTLPYLNFLARGGPNNNLKPF